MVQGQEEQAQNGGVEVRDQQPASPTGSSSSREERNARERLKKASITVLSQQAQTDETALVTESAGEADNTSSTTTNNGIRGRPAKKRSFEDLAKDEAETNDPESLGQPPLPKSGHHKRMRSRDIASGDHSNAYTKVEGDLNETLHEETDIEAQATPGGPGVLVDIPAQEEMEKETSNHNEMSAVSQTNEDQSPTGVQPPTTSILPSAFTNTSTDSPFGRTKSPENEKSPFATTETSLTSTSAFASSGLSAFAASEKSPFSATSSKPSSGFGGGGGGLMTGGFGSAKSGFGSTSGFSSSGSTGFGGPSSAFGTSRISAGGFGAPKPFGSSSAIGGGSGPSSFGTAKPFGMSSAKEDDEDEAGNEEDEASSSVANDDTKQDPRFHDQHVDTGEEDEDVHFSARAKLWVFAGKEGWKDRGTGVFKINTRILSSESVEVEDVEAQTQSSSTTGRRRARLLMRADATHRVILNSPIFKGMRFGNADGTEPSGKLMHLQSLEDGKPLPLQIKMGKEEVLKDLYRRLQELEQEA